MHGMHAWIACMVCMVTSHKCSMNRLYKYKYINTNYHAWQSLAILHVVACNCQLTRWRHCQGTHLQCSVLAVSHPHGPPWIWWKRNNGDTVSQDYYYEFINKCLSNHSLATCYRCLNLLIPALFLHAEIIIKRTNTRNKVDYMQEVIEIKTTPSLCTV